MYIKELSAPTGFKVDKTVYSLKVKAGRTMTLKVANTPKATDLQSSFSTLTWKHSLTLHRATLAYYVAGNALEPINGYYLYSELVNPVFTADGDNIKVKVAVKFIDNQTKATQISQYELTLHKDSNWKITG